MSVWGIGLLLFGIQKELAFGLIYLGIIGLIYLLRKKSPYSKSQKRWIWISSISIFLGIFFIGILSLMAGGPNFENITFITFFKKWLYSLGRETTYVEFLGRKISSLFFRIPFMILPFIFSLSAYFLFQEQIASKRRRIISIISYILSIISILFLLTMGFLKIGLFDLITMVLALIFFISLAGLFSLSERTQNLTWFGKIFLVIFYIIIVVVFICSIVPSGFGILRVISYGLF